MKFAAFVRREPDSEKTRSITINLDHVTTIEPFDDDTNLCEIRVLGAEDPIFVDASYDALARWLVVKSGVQDW